MKNLAPFTAPPASTSRSASAAASTGRPLDLFEAVLVSGPAKAPPPPPPQSAILLFDDDLEEVADLEEIAVVCEAPIDADREAEAPIALAEASPPLPAQSDDDEPSTTLVLDRSAMPLPCAAPVAPMPVAAMPVEAVASATQPLPAQSGDDEPSTTLVLDRSAMPLPCAAPVAAVPVAALPVGAAASATQPLPAQSGDDEPSTTLVLDRSAMPLGPAPTRLPSVGATPHLLALSNARRPSSIAPVALEIAEARAPGRHQARREMPTMIVRQPAQGRSGAFALGAMAGFCVMACVGLLFVGGYVARDRLGGRLASTGPAHVAPGREVPRVEVDTTAASTVTPAASTTETPAAPPVSTATASPVSPPAASPVSPPAAPQPMAATTAKPMTAASTADRAREAAAPQVIPRPAVPAQPAAPVGGQSSAKSAATGTIVLGPGVGGVEVDGVPVASGGSLHLSCGRHKVRVAGKPLRIVDVPCGGSTSL